jgi:hypothetical protein
MMDTIKIRAIWDPEAHVYYSESNFAGLVVEAASYEEFVDIAYDLLPELVENIEINEAAANAQETAAALS